MFAVNSFIEKLLDERTTVPEAGALLLQQLTAGRLDAATFLDDPKALTRLPHSVSRYLAQITLRALQSDFESLDELVDGLQALLDRNPPTLEPARPASPDRIVIPDARVVDLRYPTQSEEGHWHSGIVAMVASGPLRGTEIDIELRSDKSPEACRLVPMLWIHSTIAVYNIEPAGSGGFIGCRETFIVIEPMRQINATAVARSLHCTKPQLDQIRKGKGDTTIPTLKGTIVHAIFDRLLEGEANPDSAITEVVRKYSVQLAAVIDDSFDEVAFRADILQHVHALHVFIESNPRLKSDAHVELKRFSATIGIQGRIDAVFRSDNRMDILELKTGARIRDEDHAQLYIYRLLLSDLMRRWQRENDREMTVTARLLSSSDGNHSPLRVSTHFHQVLDARNKLVATHYALGHESPHFRYRYEGFDDETCRQCVSWTRKRCGEMSNLLGDRPLAEETSKLAYFRKWTRLVERERWVAEHDLMDLLDDGRIESRRKNFRALTGLQFIADAPPFTFAIELNTSDLQEGDSVILHTGRISSSPTFHGYIHSIDAQHVRISIPLRNLDTGLFAAKSWIVDRLPSDVSAEASHTALFDYLKRGKWGDSPLISPNSRDGALNSPESRAPSLELNRSQREAVQKASGCSEFHLIWGPPGTGKTRVIPEIIRNIHGDVLLGAFTNTAVDKMLLALLEADPSVRFLRIGRAADSPELARRLDNPGEYFSDDIAATQPTIRAIRRTMDGIRIIASTAHRACTLPYLRHRQFEMTIVDEAAQLTEPLTLGLILRARRFVLIGDDRQLPPVVRTSGLATSMYERLKQEAETASSGALTLLDTQYRMHPEIMEVSNRLFYGGRLHAGVDEELRRSPEGPSVSFVPVQTATVANPDSRRNESEAKVVSSLVQRYKALPVDQPLTIGVVSPFRAQVALLRHLLTGLDVTVDTVERFQGGERDIMILSLVRAKSSEFVFDERRFNVAITRARRKLVLVAHPELFRDSRYEWLSTFAETTG